MARYGDTYTIYLYAKINRLGKGDNLSILHCKSTAAKLKQHIKTLREKYPNTKFFLVRIFLYSVRIQGNTDQKKLRIWTLFTQCFNMPF